MAKRPNYFISGKQFRKRPNGNPAVVRGERGWENAGEGGVNGGGEDGRD